MTSKPSHLPSFYLPIRLLTVLRKILEKLLLFDSLHIIPNHQQCHKMIVTISHRVKGIKGYLL